ncbi:hypothetical protein OW763_01340 [Clostridium aestuarii]|uniref:Uncharacterized protein n=1 Tax=Clostridium aestuarii TaxID=338193 RepID=A0ABT4CVI9_9CLOT|nr:hypothetical protein [Clostridium aestuarii]MCY6482996.1 hypothetical protein [Clostridium aestuarii]
MNNMWKFSEIPHIEEVSFNKVLEKFYDFGVYGLVRENIQNSLDAKLSNSQDPIIVRIETGSINKKYIPGINEIISRINVLNARNRYTKETIDHMKKMTKVDECEYIVFEDSNTIGLKGALSGQSESKDNSWSAYAYTKGVHIEGANESFEKCRGGSHGIGKIASNAASDLYMMYFANCDEEGNKHLGGTVQLIEHNFHEKCYRATGYFTDQKEDKFYPYQNRFHDIFKKDSRGLKIIIPFLREQFHSEEEIVKCVCDSFFVAIIEKKLVISVNKITINDKSIIKYISDEKYYKERNIKDIKNEFTTLYLNTYLKFKPQKIVISDKKTKYNFKLYFNYDERIQKGRVGIIRTIGMKIEDKKIKGYANKPFNAVLIPYSSKEDDFLKMLENESHTELSFTHIKNKEYQSNAKRFINNLSKKIGEIVEETIRKNNPTDGIMDTTDILYNTVNNFKKELKETATIVKLKNENGKEKKIVKVEDKVSIGSKHIKGSKHYINIRSRKSRNYRKVKKDVGNGNKKVFLKVDPSSVMRVISNNLEYIRVDLSSNNEMKKIKSCDVSLAVVDGMGVEHMDEFNINDSYHKIIDAKTGKRLKVKDKSIIGISMKNGVFEIKSELNDKYNKTLKFVYLLEA